MTNATKVTKTTHSAYSKYLMNQRLELNQSAKFPSINYPAGTVSYLAMISVRREGSGGTPDGKA